MIRTVIDFETAYGKHPDTGENITLSKMTTEEYVRHPKFKAHGLGVKINKEEAFYVYGPELIRFLQQHPWGKSYVIAHHAHFDGAILTWRAKVRPAVWGCTLSMARAIYPHEANGLANMSKLLGLGGKGHELVNFINKWDLSATEQQALGSYCCNDVELTSDIFDALKKHFPISELRLIDWTIRKFTEPVLVVDRAPLVAAYKAERRKKRELLKQCATDKTVLASGDKFAALLLTLGVDPPKKISPSKLKDGRVNAEAVGDPPMGILPSFKVVPGMSAEAAVALKAEKGSYPWTYAFGKADEVFKMLQDHPDPQVQAVVEARLGVKSTIKETRTKRFFKIGTRGAFPVYLNYYGAHTNRWSGGDKQNAQNLNRVDPKDPTAGALRMSLCAPKGHVVCVRDLGQIEARKLSYWAGQEDMLEVFRSGGDPYDFMASKIYGYPITRKTNPDHKVPGMVGKIVILGCGYGMGAWKLQENVRVGFMGMPGILFDQTYVDVLGVDVEQFMYQKSYKKGFTFAHQEAEACRPLNVTPEAHLMHCAVTKFLVDSFRGDSDRVTALWKDCNNSLQDIILGYSRSVGGRPLVTTDKEGLVLPNGMKIRYARLHKSDSGEYKYLANARKKEWVKLYGGKITENCIAEGTLVLTDSGMKSIETISICDKVHDGVDFVSHGGIVYKSVQACIVVDGVSMTPEHKVLTNDGWKIASSNPRPHRPNIRITHSCGPRAVKQKEAQLGVSLSLRNLSSESRYRCHQGSKTRWNTKLRMLHTYSNAKKLHSRHDKPPRIPGMALNERPMPAAITPSMEKLWRSGNSRLCSVERLFKILGRYGGHIQARAYSGASKQRPRIFSRKLLLGFLPGAVSKSEEYCVRNNPPRSNARVGSLGGIRDKLRNHILPTGPQLANGQAIHTPGCNKSAVYDIINCGPRQRFVVIGNGGFFIVHNCCQALSRLVLSDQLLRLTPKLRDLVLRRGEVAEIVSSTHDELISIVPERYASEWLHTMKQEMATPPAWCSDLPLSSSGGYAVSYGACDK